MKYKSDFFFRHNTILIKTYTTMKKTILSAMAAVAMLMGGYAAAFAQEPCNTNACQAKEGFETIGEGTEKAATNSYEVVKEGTVNAYEKTKEGTVNAYEKAKEGTVNTYEKAKEGTVNLWNEAKEKIHEATE